MGAMVKKIYNSYHTLCVKSVLCAERNANLLLCAFGFVLLTGGMTDLVAAQVEYVGGRAYEVTENGADQSNFYKLLNGAFGSLVMVVAGLGAMVSAAMGSYKAAVGMLVVAVSAFAIRASVNVSLGYDDIRYSNATQ